MKIGADTDTKHLRIERYYSDDVDGVSFSFFFLDSSLVC